MRKTTFYTTLIAAIEDIEEHGYDHERIEYWLVLLIMMAEQTFKDRSKRSARDFLTDQARKYSSERNIAITHKGLPIRYFSEFTNHAQNELNARIAMTDMLIAAVRDEALDKMTRGFIGWASSVSHLTPSATDHVKLRKRLNISDLSVMERRILFDQCDKMKATLGAIIAERYGALAAVWHSRWREPEYNYREDHKSIDEVIMFMPDTHEMRLGLFVPGLPLVTDQSLPGMEPNCKCYFTYLYGLHSIPDIYLTEKGKVAKVLSGY